jgi:hypothetical protein
MQPRLAAIFEFCTIYGVPGMTWYPVLASKSSRASTCGVLGETKLLILLYTAPGNTCLAISLIALKSIMSSNQAAPFYGANFSF